MKYRVLGVPVQFSEDGTWEVCIDNAAVKQAGRLFLVATLNLIQATERLTGLQLPVRMVQIEHGCTPNIQIRVAQ
ncbi:hypothetical protein OF001_U20276 [Pseudomonas sp. OF001]|nr:hypothetical protein OF001_U20276 [Pseudomonas sp. OF001]